MFRTDLVKKNITLSDGTDLKIRSICPEDAPRLQVLFNRLSEESGYLRFLHNRKSLPDEEAKAFANVDGQSNMAFVAVHKDHDAESVVAVAHYFVISQEDAGSAEVAIVVEDRYQGKGLGTYLLKHLASYAKTHGVHTFVATVHYSNDRIMRLIRRSGLLNKRKLSSGVWEIQVELSSELECKGIEIRMYKPFTKL